MKKLIEIKSDCLDIVERIKSIDNAYFVMFNLSNNTFELHDKSQRRTFVFTFPYDALDERAYLYVLKTRVQNSDKIFDEIEQKNKNRDKAIKKEILNDFEEKLYDSKRDFKVGL